MTQLGSHFITLNIVRPVSWQVVRDRLLEFEEWLSSEVAHVGPVLERRIYLLSRDFGLAIELIPSEEQLQWIMSSGMPVGMQPIEEICETLRQRIQNKIHKEDGSLKKLPTIRPCRLVVYPNYDLGSDVDDVVREFLRRPPIDVSSHFDEVWIASETYLARLV
jgi:hypothetical protein